MAQAIMTTQPTVEWALWTKEYLADNMVFASVLVWRKICHIMYREKGGMIFVCPKYLKFPGPAPTPPSFVSSASMIVRFGLRVIGVGAGPPKVSNSVVLTDLPVPVGPGASVCFMLRRRSFLRYFIRTESIVGTRISLYFMRKFTSYSLMVVSQPTHCCVLTSK